jgi:hypothetical protein
MGHNSDKELKQVDMLIKPKASISRRFWQVAVSDGLLK